jgi:hypothetical protein
MARCRVDESLERTVVNGFEFPLGVYPVEAMTPRAGYAVEFEPADGDEEGQWEEWPDRYHFDIVITASRLEPLCRSLLGLFPGRVYPILDVLGRDAYREVDPYISYELVGMDRFLDALRRYRGYFFEDGLCGFGAMVDEPFMYLFVDEHKILTIRAQPDIKEKIERILAAFDLEPTEAPAGADAASHEHRGVLVMADDRPDLLNEDEIVEELRDDWRLTLNVEPDTNFDEDGKPLGIVPWRCLVRCLQDPDGPPRYIDIFLTASNLQSADELCLDTAEEMLPEGVEEWEEAMVISADRVDAETAEEWMKEKGLPPLGKTEEERIIWKTWLE